MSLENEQSQPEGNEPEALEPSLTPSETPTEPQGPLDLDSVDKFKFGGREWTPKEFQSAYMRQQDYSKKTAEIAQERKYYDNLIYDLKSVKTNPQLVAQFKQVYPQKYHAYVDELIEQAKSQQTSAQPESSQQPALPKEFLELRQEVDAFKKERFDAEVAKHTAELDQTIATMSKKYPFADEDTVISKAVALQERGQLVDGKVWDGLFKMVSERNEKMLKERQAEQIKQQKQANSKAKDVPFGGGTPGQAPRQFKTIKEASDAARQDFANQ